MTEDPDPTKSAAETAAGAEFRAELNHKMRTPLNAIIGFAELLLLQPGGSRNDGDVQQILKSARELLGIIESELGGPIGETTNQRSAPSVPHLCDVLYIEDDMVNFTLASRIMEFRPTVSLMHAADGHLGCHLAETHLPRLILLDLNLPEMNGSEVLRQLKNASATADIPVVVLSADATPSQIERLLTAGAKNYLTKPYEIDEFLAIVDEYTAVPRAEATAEAA